jgi:DNA-binding response OmpR family regulator
VPFIFLTAKAERSDFRKGMEMGADDYITKPFTDIELLNSIERRLRKVELLKKEYSQDVNGVHAFMKDLGREDALKALSEGRNINHYKKKQLI